jgi:spore maturation protein CgeB
MRWLIGHPGPSFSVADVYDGWVEALRGLGEEVFGFNMDRRLQFYDAALIHPEGHPAPYKAMTREQAVGRAVCTIYEELYKWWPHVVLLVSAFWYPPQILDLIRARGHKVVLLHTESPYQDGEQLIRAAHADVNLVNDPANLAAYAELGPAEYMPHAFRESVHYPRRPRARYRHDLAFVGTGFPSRVKFFEQMDLAGLGVHLAGPWLDLPADSPLRDWTMTDDEACVDNADTAEIYRRSRTGINFYRREGEDDHLGEGWAIGPREIEMAACGLWFARDARPESNELFPMLPAFSGPGEAAEQIRWALAHPRAREKAAAAAREAIADRTFSNNARRLLKLLDK